MKGKIDGKITISDGGAGQGPTKFLAAYKPQKGPIIVLIKPS